MDGARFANALAAMPDASPADMTWRAGVDALCFGSTKNGTLCGEVLVLFRERSGWLQGRRGGAAGALAEAAARHKRGGLLLEKHRFVSAQVRVRAAD
jgi:threonine aldolase